VINIALTIKIVFSGFFVIFMWVSSGVKITIEKIEKSP